jgi:hypothetical protein
MRPYGVCTARSVTDLLPGATGVLVLADGTVFQGVGVGAEGQALGEVVFNTAMTGYQEILTDPSYMSQILVFTFPHVGNVGVNVEDLEQMGGGADTSAVGAVFRDLPTDPANWRSEGASRLRLNSEGTGGTIVCPMARAIRWPLGWLPVANTNRSAITTPPSRKPSRKTPSWTWAVCKAWVD